MSTTELHDLEALLARMLPDPRGFADRVLRQLLDRLSTEVQSPDMVAGYDIAVHEQLDDSNVVLSAALGACECWGSDPNCVICSGAGSAGWIDPDGQLYDEIVMPAVRRMSNEESANERIPPSNERSETT